jgi:hypothetical protein
MGETFSSRRGFYLATSKKMTKLFKTTKVGES